MISAYTISQKPQKWNLANVNWFNLVEDTAIPDVEKYHQAFKHKEWYPSYRYIAYLADKRNRAIQALLEKYPETSEILCCDSYYLEQTDALSRLIKDYLRIEEACILSGAAWGIVRARIKDILRPEISWFDKWGVSELQFVPFGWDPRKDPVTFRYRVPLEGLFRVHSVIGVHIFPRSIWENGARCGVTEDIHVCEHGTLCEKSGLPVYVDFNAEFWREKIYSIPHCIRNSLHLGRFLKI